MLQGWALFLFSAAYVALLFGVASYGDRRVAVAGAPPRKPWVYSLALGVYATSWTFYGAVGRAASSGWDFLPIYLGPILLFGLGAALIARLIRVSKHHNITSIADFIGARYGRHQALAMMVTLVAVIGTLPYIALQLKAVAFGFEILASPAFEAGAPVARASFFGDSALVIALLLGIFAILFGTRQVVSSENHHGMVLAIAFESMVKLVAFLAVGLYVCYGLYDGIGDAYAQAATLPQMNAPLLEDAWRAGFVAQTILAAIAVICLPRQFHVSVVESTSRHDLRRARWLLPAYLTAISLFVIPIATAGLHFLPAGQSADTFLLGLSIASDKPWLALVAYLGGFSAATSMVIVETIALSTMLSNEVLMPLLIRSPRLRLADRDDLSDLLKRIRRAAILAIVAAAYVYYRFFTGPGSLAAIGLLSFAAVAQFAPAVFGGMLWRGGSYAGAVAGLVTGFAVWAYTLLLPALLTATGAGTDFLAEGPAGLAWLRPQALFGTDLLDDITHGALWSLGLNLLCYLGVPLLSAPGLSERLRASRFLQDPQSTEPGAPVQAKVSATVGDLVALIERVLGPEQARAELDLYAVRHGRDRLRPELRASSELIRYTEHRLAGALGASSARLVLASALRGRDMQLEDVILLLDETSHEIQFNRELLRATLEHLPQGVSVVDKDLRLVAWNQRYVELFDYPEGLIHVGRPIEDVFRFNAERGLFGQGRIEDQVARRLSHLRAGTPHMHERELPSGVVIEVRGNPMPGGGFVTSYSDVTAYKQAQRQLQDANDTLETRVVERTQALDEAKLAAERANLAKTRFLASASHDLVQPLNAARLFVSSIARDSLPAEAARTVGQVEQSLTAAESLLGALLDISRLDAAAQDVRREHFPLARVLEPLAAEFAALAAPRGLGLRVVPTRAIVHTDPALLRRVLQNFLSNALRYTRRGRVLLGCRRTREGAIRIEVWDTGPGIPERQQREIFEEFRRFDTEDGGGAERGLGLGLAIADRLARLLGHRLALRSWPGRGSVFSLTVPLGEAQAVAAVKPAAPRRSGDRLVGLRVLCIDNEPAVLEGLQALLGSWGCEVSLARDRRDAERHWQQTGEVPELALVDFHLDPDPEGDTDGIHAITRLQLIWGVAVPGIVLTADHTQAARLAAAENGLALLPKPIKPAALRALMSRQVGTRSGPLPA